MKPGWLIGCISGIVMASGAAFQAARGSRRSPGLGDDQLEPFTELLPVGVFETDPDGYCTFSNELACRMAGLEITGAIGKAWTEAIHPDDRERLLAEWAASASSGRPWRTEYRFLHKDGTVVWALSEMRSRCDRNGCIRSFVGAVTDITAQKRVEQELEEARANLEDRVAQRTANLVEVNENLSREIAVRQRVEHALLESERRLRTIAEHAPCYIYMKDLDGRYVFTSGPEADARTRFGQWAVGTTDHDLFPKDIADAIVANDRRVIASGEALKFEEVVDLQDGMRNTLSVKFPLLDTAGNIYAVGGISVDVSETRRLARELEKRREELAHVLRLHSMGEVISEIAHELNQPLSAIVNYAGGAITRLRNGKAEVADALEVFERIAEQGLRAAQLIRRIRGFVRSNSYETESVDVNKLVADATEILRVAQHEHVRLHLDLEPTLPHIDGEAVQVEQVIMNLLRNGFDAMAATERRELTVRTRSLGTAIELLVSDTGTGVEPALRERVFEAFFSTKKGGLGMGLSITRNIVEAHGGSIEFHLNEDRGTTFRVVLPLESILTELPDTAERRTGAKTR